MKMNKYIKRVISVVLALSILSVTLLAPIKRQTLKTANMSRKFTLPTARMQMRQRRFLRTRDILLSRVTLTKAAKPIL